MAVPVIDLKNIDGSERKAIMAKIAEACETPGFFQLINHGIDHGLMDRVKEVCSQQYKINREQIFNNSLAVKSLNEAIEAETKENSVAKIENMDWEDVFQVQEMSDTNSWPSEPKNFKETIEEFRSQIFALTEKLLEIISENLGLEKGYIKSVFAGVDKPFFGTKVSHYPPCPRPDLIRGIRAHTDAGGLILLYQDDEVPGLQVLSNGNWVDVQPLHYSIVVNIGDQLEVVSNGRYKSAWHHILPTKDGNRLSVASFYNPSYNAVVSPAPQLITKMNGDTTHELCSYPKYLFGDYMNVYVEQKYEEKEPRFEAMGKMNKQVA